MPPEEQTGGDYGLEYECASEYDKRDFEQSGNLLSNMVTPSEKSLDTVVEENAFLPAKVSPAKVIGSFVGDAVGYVRKGLEYSGRAIIGMLLGLPYHAVVQPIKFIVNTPGKIKDIYTERQEKLSEYTLQIEKESGQLSLPTEAESKKGAVSLDNKVGALSKPKYDNNFNDNNFNVNPF